MTPDEEADVVVIGSGIGGLCAAMMSGNLLRMDPDGGSQKVFANTGGRVLGCDFDGEGRMIAADAMKGLLAITDDAHVKVLADHVSSDDRVRYANSIVVAPDGTIYFTDASARFAPELWGGTYVASLFVINEDGRVVEDLQDPGGAYPETTGATETADRLYIHSLHAPVIGWVPL